MKIRDFHSYPTSEKLNEGLFKKFGTQVDLNKYSREQLENYRNLLRTKINQAELSSKFNELLANESYQKDKMILNLLNTKIDEMLDETTNN